MKSIDRNNKTDKELEKSLSILKATLDSTTDGILVVDKKGNIECFNNKFLEMWKIPESIIKQMDDKKTLDFVLNQLKNPKAFLNKVMELYNKLDEESFDILEFDDGRTFERYSKPQRIGTKIEGRVWSFRDITERKRAELALIESEQRHRALVEHAYDLISETDIVGRFLYVSPNHKEQLGYETEELEGKSIFEFVHKDDINETTKEFTKTIQTLASGHAICRFKHKNGEWRWLECAGKPFKTATNEIRLVIVSRDITKRKIAEEALKDSINQLSKKNRYETILSTVTRSIHKSINLQDVLENTVEALSKNIGGVESVAVYLVEGKYVVLKAHRRLPKWFTKQLDKIPYPKGFIWKTIIDAKPIYIPVVDKDSIIGPAGRKLGTKSYLSMPINYKGQVVGAIGINSFKKNVFDEEELKLLKVVAEQIETAFDNALQTEALREALAEVERLKNRLETENIYLQEEIRNEYNFEEILGRSEEINKVLQMVEQVAHTDSAVLIIGETGTGKELIARAIHNISSRKDRPLVKVNCGAISAGLVESELFGHEKGSFTGAIQKRIGRFELAHCGTIFFRRSRRTPT